MTLFTVTSVLLLTAIVLFIRGDRLHNYLVLESEKILQNADFETYQEHPQKLSSGGLDFVDLLAKRKDFIVCIEVETSARYAKTNAIKAQQLGLPLVVIVPDQRVKKSVQNKLIQVNIKPGGYDIYILLLSQLKQEVTKCFPLFSAANTNGKTKK
ncbi:MAG: hypothetical protein KAS23_05055 [Anaerohalosphaera sp.]|nr:hypothetical protein [Anaerohalosphaera sp.]